MWVFTFNKSGFLNMDSTNVTGWLPYHLDDSYHKVLRSDTYILGEINMELFIEQTEIVRWRSFLVVVSLMQIFVNIPYWFHE